MTSSLPVVVPDQLKNRGLRFTRLRPAILGDKNSGKGPTDKRFYDEGALREDDPSLSSHLEAGLGFGMVCNYGDLIGFDADQGELLEEMGVMARLPPTLTDRAPHKTESLHLYYICPGLPRTFHFWHPSILAPEEEDEEGKIQPRKRLELGQICAGRGHITGPGAPHWSGGRREIIDDSPLAEISIDDLKAILKGVVFSEDPTKNPSFEDAAGLVDTSQWDRLREMEREARKARRGRGDDLSLSERIGDIKKVLSAYAWNPTTTSGDNWKGPHPREFSKSKTALVVEVKRGLWHCKHHEATSGGDAASLVALFEGLITCEEHHKLRDKDLFLKVVKACEERGLISPSDREPKATTTDAARELLEILETKLSADPDGWAQDPDVKRLLASYRKRDAVGAEALLKRAGVRGDLKKALLADLKRIDSDEKARRRRATAAKGCTTEEDDGEGFSLLDFCYLTDEGKYIFSPTTATKSIIAKSKLAMTATEPDIHRFDGQIYRNDGDRKIDLNLCHVAKDHVLGKNVQEVIRRVKNELLEDPVVFDGNPYLLGVKNGVVDLRTGEFRDYLPEDLITYQLDVTYDPAARCPRFVKFLEEIQPNVVDRLTLADWYPATAIRKPLPYVLFLLGLGRNGKGIYERLIKRFFGASAFRDMPLAEVTKNNFAAGNFYKKLGWIATEQSGKKKATIGTDFIKLVTGNGSIDADRKNLSRIQFEAYFQTIVDTNAMPVIEDTSVGWMERFCKQDMPYVFVSNPDPKNPLERQKDPHLFDKLTTDSELSGILNLLIWRAKEICETEAITKRPASELFGEYTKQSASVSTFCDLFLEYEEGLTEPNVPTIDIYEAYKKWCSYLVGEVVDEAYFGRYLRRLCNNRQPSRPRRDGKRLTAYPGLLFHEDRVKTAIEGLSKGWTGRDGHGQVVDEKDFSKTDNKRTSGTSGQVELWNQIVKRFGPSRPEVQEDNEKDFLSKGEIHQNTRPTRPLVPPITGDPKNGKSTRPLPVHTSPLPVQVEPEGGELAGEMPEPSEPEEHQSIAANLEEAARREGDYLEHVKTPEPKAKGRRLDRLYDVLRYSKNYGILYQPKDKALEYSPWAVNVAKSCSHGCKYCYGPSVARKTKDQYRDVPDPKTDLIKRINAELTRALKDGCDIPRVHLTFSGDFYDPRAMEGSSEFSSSEEMTRAVIEAVHSHGVGVQILTKSREAARDFDLLGPRDRFGVSLTFLDPEKSKEWEPGAALPDDRLRALEEAHKRGIETWASLEPVIDPDETMELIRRSAEYVDIFAVGKWNHDTRADSIDWRKFASEVVRLLDSLGCDYYIKDDLKRYLPAERARTKKEVERSPPKNDPSEESEALEVARALQAAGKRVTFGNVETHLNKAEGYVETSRVWGFLRALGALGWTTDKAGVLHPPTSEEVVG